MPYCKVLWFTAGKESANSFQVAHEALLPLSVESFTQTAGLSTVCMVSPSVTFGLLCRQLT